MRLTLSYLARTILIICSAVAASAIDVRPAAAVSWSNPHHAYVLIAGFNAADDYVAEISVDKKPSETLKLGGSRAQFCQVDALAVGPQGNLYISGYFGENCSTNAFPGVEIFAAGAHGNVSPIATISGNKTLMNDPFGMAFDRPGNLYVVEQHGGHLAFGAVNVYPPGAAGNVAPVATITGRKTSFSAIYWIAVDDTGEIFVSQGATTCQILKFLPGTNGNVAPIANVSFSPYANGFGELQVAGTTLYASVGIMRDEQPGIYELDTTDLSLFNVLTNPRFTQTFGDVDSVGNLYVENVHRTRGLGCGISRFYEFGPGQSQPSRIRATGTNCGGGYTVDGP